MATQADVRRIDNAAVAADKATGRVLSSQWDGLSPHLLATLYPVSADGQREVNTPIVQAAVTDFNTEFVANWQSPFEQTGPDNKMPSVMAMLQSGSLGSYGETLFGKNPDGDGFAAKLARDIAEFSREGQGRSGMTKLNSTQVFTGAPPVKFSMTLHFQAFADPTAEVEEPVHQLIAWHLSRELAPNGSIISALQALKDGRGGLKALMPSLSPQMVALSYGGLLHSPVVIESLTLPGSGPRYIDGRMLSADVQVCISTLTALDARDWTFARNGQPTRLFSNS